MLMYNKRLQMKKRQFLTLRYLKFNEQEMNMKYFNNNNNGQTNPSSWNDLATVVPSFFTIWLSTSSLFTPAKQVYQAKGNIQEVDPTLVVFVVIAESLPALYQVQIRALLAVLDENDNYLHLQRPTIHSVLST